MLNTDSCTLYFYSGIYLHTHGDGEGFDKTWQIW